jgi:PAS domain S-box-containing protein
MWLGITAAACILGQAIIVRWHDAFFDLFPAEAHFVFHTIAEFTSILLSFAIFAIGWYGYKQRSDSRNLVLALTFFAVGLVDFFHSFSFPDLPDFLTANTLEKAAIFFMAARIIGALGILIVAVIAPKPPPRWLPPHLLLGTVGGLVLALILVESYQPQVFPAMLNDDGSLTSIHRFLEIAVIALAAGVVLILQRRQLFNRTSTLLIQVALIVAVFSDLPFLLLDESYDTYFISHIYNSVAYYFILRAVFVSSLQQPYLELKKTREDLENSFGTIGVALTSSLELDKVLSLIATLASDLLNSPHALVALKREGEESLVVRATRGLENPPTEIPLKDNLAGLVWQTRSAVRVEDILDRSQQYRSVIAASEGLRSAVAAPILKDKVILGEIAVYSDQEKAFDEADARLLTAFARQAAVAIENARLFESEKRERENTQIYQNLVGVLMVALNGEGKITMINRKGAEILGLPEEEIIGKDWFDNFIPERIKDEVKEVFYRLMAGEAEPVEHYDNPLVNSQGEERIMAWHNRLLWDSEGNITGTLSSGDDVTERRKAEKLLSESESLLKSYAAQLAILHDISLQLNRETDTNRLLETVLKGAMQVTGAGVGLMTLIIEGKTEVVSLHYADWYGERCEIEANPERLHTLIEKKLRAHGHESLRLAKPYWKDTEFDMPPGHLDLRGLLLGTLRDVRGRIKGHFMMSNKQGDAEFSAQDEEIISLLAAQSSVALISAENFGREHYIAELLQQALLPPIPLREDIEIGLLYRSAGPYGRVGGDFYDFVDLKDGRIAVAVGDVSGKGLEVATYTAMLKYSLRAYLHEKLTPGECLSHLNATISDQLSEEKFITIFLAIIEPKNLQMSFSSAGHLPPIICNERGASIVSHSVAVPLGVLQAQTYTTTQISLQSVCQLIFYTDGLTEARPDRGEPFGEDSVIRVASGKCDLSAQVLADQLMSAAVDYSGGVLRDDITLMVVHLFS